MTAMARKIKLLNTFRILRGLGVEPRSMASLMHIAGFPRAAVLMAGLSAALASQPALETKGPPLEELAGLVGQPADIAPSAYQFRADRPAAQNPPETAFLFTNGVGHKREGVLCGLLWEEPRPVKRIELIWPKQPATLPQPEALAVRWFSQGNSSSWWSRREAHSDKRPGLLIAQKPEVSADGRVFAYDVAAVSPENAMDNLVVAVTPNVQPGHPPVAVPSVRVFTTQSWKRAALEVEWGFEVGADRKDFSGSLEAYNGVIGPIAPLGGEGGTRVTGQCAWRSVPGGNGRRGLALEVLYLGDSYNTPLWPQQGTLEGANRTIITVRTQSGSFSFLPADLETGPILAPEFGFFVAPAGSETGAARFQRELAAKGLKTIRQKVRAHPEQTWEEAMQALHPGPTFPPYPRPEFEPVARIEVPEPRLVDAWRVGAWHLLRGCPKDAQGRYIIKDFPYDALAHETGLIIRALDLMGLPEAAAQGLARWLDRDESKPLRMDGQFGDTVGVLSGVEWDWQHTGGPGLMQWHMAEHYLLTGDKEWLRKAAPRLLANADWMIRQRKSFMRDVPGRERAWCYGLLPPHNIYDSTNWRLWYESNANYYFGLKRFAEVIAALDPEAGRKYLSEAQAYAKCILAAAEKSFVLSPVIRVRDGAYRSFLPPAPYLRGPASRSTVASFGSPEHTPGLYADAIRGGAHLINLSQLLPRGDARAQGTVDVLEDRLLLEHHRLPMRTKDYNPERDWFSGAGWYYQCGIERTPNIHLQWDDVPNFLRSFYNDYAVDVVVGPYTFNEHTTRGPSDKSFEEAAFLERLRNMLVMEEDGSLWLARATPRAWLTHGKKIAVRDAPTHFGAVGFEIVSAVNDGSIAATVEMPSRASPKTVLLRLRHPEETPIKSLSVNGQPWADYDPGQELVRLHHLSGAVKVRAVY